MKSPLGTVPEAFRLIVARDGLECHVCRQGIFNFAAAVVDRDVLRHQRCRFRTRTVDEIVCELLAERDGLTCGLCRQDLKRFRDGNPDHIIPRSHGGTDDLDNLRLTHPQCNSARGNRDCPRCEDGRFPARCTGPIILGPLTVPAILQ